MRRDNQFLRWQTLVVSINACLIAATMVWPHVPGSLPGRRFILTALAQFNLSFEMNFAVWWAGVCLLLVGLVSYELFSSRGGRHWLGVSVLFVGLSFDELASIHERLAWYLSTAEMGLILIAGLLLLAPAMVVMLPTDRYRSSATLILGGLILMLTAIPQEYVEIQIGVPHWLEGLRAGLEEGAELVGSYLCLCGVLHERVLPTPRTSRWSFVPDLSRFRSLSAILGVALAAQLLLAFFAVTAVDVSHRGNPAAYIPSIFLLLASLRCSQMKHEPAGHSSLLLALTLSVASVVTLYLLPPVSPASLTAYAVPMLWVSYLLVVTVAAALCPDPARAQSLVAVVTVIGFVALLLDDPFAHYAGIGVVTYSISRWLLVSEEDSFSGDRTSDRKARNPLRDRSPSRMSHPDKPSIARIPEQG